MADDEVSVRDLRQNLSVYLRRVQEGTTLAVTSRGERVAVLAPIGSASRVERLIAEDRVSRPTRSWRDPAPAPAEARATPTEALLAMRDEDRR
jgi:prevent-host-death family protein